MRYLESAQIIVGGIMNRFYIKLGESAIILMSPYKILVTYL